MTLHSSSQFSKRNSRQAFSLRFPTWYDPSSTLTLKSIIQDQAIVRHVKVNQVYSHYQEFCSPLVLATLTYGVSDQGLLQLGRHLTFPSLLLNQPKLHPELSFGFNRLFYGNLTINGKNIQESPSDFKIKEGLFIVSKYDGLEITRSFWTGVDFAGVIETIEIRNKGTKSVHLNYQDRSFQIEIPAKITKTGKPYWLRVLPSHQQVDCMIPAKKSWTLTYLYHASEEQIVTPFSLIEAVQKREQLFLDAMSKHLVMESPEPILNFAFLLAQERFLEHQFITPQGILLTSGDTESSLLTIHSLDQGWYCNPVMAYCLDSSESLIKGYRLLADSIQISHGVASSLLATDPVEPIKPNRYDGASYFAAGLSRFLLHQGNKDLAQSFLSTLASCLAECKRGQNEKGLLLSKKEEWTHSARKRPSLSQNCYYYDALISMTYLAQELGFDPAPYQSDADTLRQDILSYFKHTVDDQDYLQHVGNAKSIHASISLPLSLGIRDYKNGTLVKLWSTELLSNDTMRVSSLKETTSDRLMLIALQSTFQADQVELAYSNLLSFSKSRLLGNRQGTTSSFLEGTVENALYLRVVLEGILGLRPTGFATMSLTLQLPIDWSELTLKNLHLFQETYDIHIIQEVEKNICHFALLQAQDVVYSVDVTNHQPFIIDCRVWKKREEPIEELPVETPLPESSTPLETSGHCC